MQVTDQNFQEEVMKYDKPVLIDFYATWCGPCKMLAPIIEELAPKYEGKVKIVKLDVDENPHTAEQFSVQSIPTLVFIKNGKELERLNGFQAKEVLEEKLNAMQ